jgi:hypothetical protein
MLDERIRRHLMEAEPSELRGEGGSELARLVRRDTEVRAAAQDLLHGMRELDTALSAPGPSRIAAFPRWMRWRNFGLATGLAAATLAALLLSSPDVQLPADDSASVPLTATLEVESDRRFAVFATNNPDIAIVWLFDEEER